MSERRPLGDVDDKAPFLDERPVSQTDPKRLGEMGENMSKRHVLQSRKRAAFTRSSHSKYIFMPEPRIA